MRPQKNSKRTSLVPGRSFRDRADTRLSLSLVEPQENYFPYQHCGRQLTGAYWLDLTTRFINAILSRSFSICTGTSEKAMYSSSVLYGLSPISSPHLSYSEPLLQVPLAAFIHLASGSGFAFKKMQMRCYHFCYMVAVYCPNCVGSSHSSVA